MNFSQWVLSSQILHPMIVHFPVALWLTGTLLYMLSFSHKLWWLRVPAIVTGVLGTLTGWAALKTGIGAYHQVAAELCDLHVLKKHAEQADVAFTFFWVSWLVIALTHMIHARFFANRKIPDWFSGVTVIGVLLGSAFLVMTGIKGERLVFEQNAATAAAGIPVGRTAACAR